MEPRTLERLTGFVKEGLRAHSSLVTSPIASQHSVTALGMTERGQKEVLGHCLRLSS